MAFLQGNRTGGDCALTGKVLVVIGGTSGLGFSAAQAFVAADARVVVVGRDFKDTGEARDVLGEAGRTLEGDARAPETSAIAIRTALREFGAFHGLYHVAGGSGRSRGDGVLHEITDEGWAYTLEENLTSLFYSNRAAVRCWLERKERGTVLNMGSVLAYAPSPRHFGTHAYAAAKAAIIGLTRAAAARYAPDNIRFNAVAPGLIETPMSQRACGDPEIVRFLAGKQPLDGGRVGSPTDLDAAAVYFMSDASRWVTGQVLAVDGGWSVC